MASRAELLELNRLLFDTIMREIAREKPRSTIVAIARDILREAGVLAEVTTRAQQRAALESLGAAAEEMRLPFSVHRAAKLKDR
jgi:hypothetical protein